MKNITYKIGNLELRRVQNIINDSYYLEIVRWGNRDGDIYCYTIAIFEEGENYFLKSVGDRIILGHEEWIDFGILTKAGFEFLNDIAYEDDDDE